MFKDALVRGTGSFEGYLPPLRILKRGLVVPRIFPVKIRQRGYNERGVYPFIDAFKFIGTPVNEPQLQGIRKENRLSENYGAVKIPKSLMEGVDPGSTRLIVGEDNEDYIIAGLLPTSALRWDALRNTSKEEGIVYALMNDFPTINPQDLMDVWRSFRNPRAVPA